jgi:hypothetical protein
MAIGDYTTIAQQPLQNTVLGQTEKGRIVLREPLEAPSGWTKFKAALSNVPLLGRIGSLQEARRTVAEYPIKLENYRISNRQILSGFVRDLQTRFGEHVADMAMRDLRPLEGAPLSQRTVATILGNAERTEKHFKAQTNIAVTRFLESPLAGGQRLPNETDMNGVYLDMGFELGRDGGGWSEALGPGASKLVASLVRLAISENADYGKGTIDNRTIEFAARDALRFLAELKEDLATVTGMTDETMDDILSRVGERGSEDEVKAYARELVIVDRLERHLDRRNPESMLGKIVSDLVKMHDLPAPSQAVLKSITGSMIESLVSVIHAMPHEFGCDPDLGSVCEALDKRLSLYVNAAVEEHMKALEGLSRPSDVITRDQAEVLIHVAETRRIDGVQVGEYRTVGDLIASTLQKVSDFTMSGSPQAVLDSFRTVLKSVEDGIERMRFHGGETMQEAGSLLGGEMVNQLMLEFSRFAAAGLTPEEASDLLTRLTGDEAKGLIAGMSRSSDMVVGGAMPTIFTLMVQAVAERSGQDPETALRTSNDLGSGGGRGLSDLRGDLAIAILNSAPEKIDDRGVLSGSPNGRLVQKDFRADSLKDKVGGIVLDSVTTLKVKEGSWLPDQTLADLNRADYRVNGLVIEGNTPETRLQSFTEAFAMTDPNMSRAIGRCMNQEALNTLVGTGNSTAFGEGNMMVGGVNAKTMHEAVRQEDGSWLVRSTLLQTPAALGLLSGETRMIKSDGLSLYSITFRITPDEMGGEPVTTVEKTDVIFAF